MNAAAGAPGIITPAAGGAPYAAPGGVGAWGENMPTGCVDVAYADCAGEAPYESYELCAGAGGSEGAPPYDKTPPPALSYAPWPYAIWSAPLWPYAFWPYGS